MADSYRQIAVDAIAKLYSEECTTEQEFGTADPAENYHEESEALQARVDALREHDASG